MSELTEMVSEALRLISGGDADTYSAIWTSMKVSVLATAIATALALPAGLVVGLCEFRGKRMVNLLLNTTLSMPTVVIGLFVFLLLSRKGPFGSLDLLFSSWAMVIGEILLALPLLTAFMAAAAASVPKEVQETALALGASWWQSAWLVVEEARFAMVAAVVAGFGRVIAEIGAALMLGGNIRGVTRTMTTAIQFETSRGNFALALALGLILMLVAFAANLVFHHFQQRSKARP